MPRPFRLLVTPPAPAAWNMALDAVLLEGVAAGTSPPTIRLLAFDPPAALVGAYQSVESEVRESYCRERGIDVNRRVTGGGAIFFDPSQVGWETVCRFEDLGLPGRPSEGALERLSAPAVAALRTLGLDASYRPRNDIEVGGRKISGTGGTDLRGALLFQGTLLVDFDVETMVRALRVPVEKLRRQEIEGLRDRVTWLARELAPGPVPDRDSLHALLARSFEGELGIELRAAPGLSSDEEAALAEALPRHESEGWVRGRGRPGGELLKGIVPTDGGVVRALVRTGADRRRITAATLSGDFFAYPRRAVYDLEARLKSVAARDIPTVVADFFAEGGVEIPGVGADGITAALLEALDRADGERFGLDRRQQNAIFPVGGRLDEVAALGPSHLLLPYCAKPPSCDRRSEDGCDECGECTVGEAYAAGGRAGLAVTSITSFSHLMETLSRLRREGATAYLGSCCEAFYVKHRREMETAGLPGILFDVQGSETSYNLGKTSYSYRGEYEGETSVDLELLGSLVRACSGGSGE